MVGIEIQWLNIPQTHKLEKYRSSIRRPNLPVTQDVRQNRDMVSFYNSQKLY